MAELMVKAESVHKRFGRLEVLCGITLEVERGEVMCIIGPSGSGKSTFLRTINHLERINRGRLYVDGVLVVCDEVLTPDSSRIWPAEHVRSGETPPSFDKQPFRDWLSAQTWDRTPPPPDVPEDVVRVTSDRYVACYERVTGHALRDWYGE